MQYLITAATSFPIQDYPQQSPRMKQFGFLMSATVCGIASLISSGLAAQAKPTIKPADYGQWETPGSPRLSPHGDWTAVSISRMNDSGELRIIRNADDSTIVIPFGQSPSFSATGEWVAYTVGVSPAERERLTQEKKPVRNGARIRNLKTGVVISESDVSSLAFSPNGQFITLVRSSQQGRQGNDVLVYDLAKRTFLTFTSVREHAWSNSPSGNALLALAVDGQGSSGHAFQIYDASSNTLRVLSNNATPFQALSWRAQSNEVAVLKSVVDKAYKDTASVLMIWTDATSEAAPAVLDPAATSDFPEGMRIAPYRKPSWSDDGRTIFFGLRPREPVADAIRKSAEKVSDVEIWHTNDVRMFEQQKAQINQDLRATLLTAWNRDNGRIVRIGTDLFEQSAVLEGGRWATEIDRKPYPWEWKFGRNVQDVYAVNVSNGERSRILERVRHYYGGDPTGARIAWSDGRDYWILDLESGRRTNLTSALTRSGKADFVDHDNDHPTDIPHIFSIAGWTRSGDALLVNDTHDVWRLPVDGSAATRLTSGYRDNVTFRISGSASFGASVVDRATDLDKPFYFTLSGRATKQSGYARRNPDGSVERMVLADAAHSAFTKSDSADVVAFIRQRYDSSPNVFVGGTPSSAKAITATNPQQSRYAWGKVELMNFRSTIGVPLQALLYYPANYDPTRKYPLIVYTYERLSQGLHRYIAPSDRDYYNATVFTQNGYFVLMPDIVFRPREPGIGTKYAVEPAVRSVIARGLVDPRQVGHVGHSQGGYEAAYLATHSTLFATTIVGSGITDMYSFAGQLHWSGGSAEFDHWETGQFRMQVAPWEDPKAMIDNSPLARVNQMAAKSMLIEVGSVDGTVDPRQGSLFYNYARRAGKFVVMLTYPGEAHGLAKRENQRDYQNRILEWFGHFLKGEPAPRWITDGQTALERKALLDANKP